MLITARKQSCAKVMCLHLSVHHSVHWGMSSSGSWGCTYQARHAHKRLYMVLPKYSKIQVLPGITSCRLVKDNKQAIELNSLLINNMPKDGYG